MIFLSGTSSSNDNRLISTRSTNQWHKHQTASAVFCRKLYCTLPRWDTISTLETTTVYSHAVTSRKSSRVIVTDCRDHEKRSVASSCFYGISVWISQMWHQTVTDNVVPWITMYIIFSHNHKEDQLTVAYSPLPMLKCWHATRNLVMLTWISQWCVYIS